MSFTQKAKNVVVVILCFAFVPVLSFLLIFGGYVIQSHREWEAQEKLVKQLVAERASKEVVIEKLGSRFVDYSVGSGNEASRTNFLTEPPGRYIVEREKLSKYPGALFYSTPDIMTWIFLDSDNRAVDHALNQQ